MVVKTNQGEMIKKTPNGSYTNESREKKSNHDTVESAETISRYGESNNVIATIRGAVSVMALWGTWLSGIFSPVWLLLLYYFEFYKCFTFFLTLIITLYLIKVKGNRYFVRFILDMSYWFKDGTCLYVENSLKDVDPEGPILICMHPHGIFCQGFFLNGSARIMARKPEKYLPGIFQNASLKSTGVAEPNLFRIPFIKTFLVSK